MQLNDYWLRGLSPRAKVLDVFSLATLISFSDLQGLVLSSFSLIVPTFQCFLQTVMGEFMGKAGMFVLWHSCLRRKIGALNI